jgi:RNA polymerase sigma-70 factor (ECF subfamily)
MAEPTSRRARASQKARLKWESVFILNQAGRILILPGMSRDAAGNTGRFKTTRWSLILSSLDGESGETRAREALAQLCRIYWRPIFAFVCRKGYSVPDAQDLTQDFFVVILEGDLLQRADRERGRFRSLLLKSLQNFLIDVHSRSHAKKRGGDLQFVSWDEWTAEAPSRLAIPTTALESWPAERIFDVRWAATVAEHALRRLQEECERHGRRRVFDALSSSLTAERDDISYEVLARELGAGTVEIKSLLHRLRQRYRQLLREEVAATVAQPGDVDDELRYLVAALAASTQQNGEGRL